ncbi:hypothetical protein TruAng_011846 [Truncatella angustata]|nr:hypothetical protein TruAng_011846 [Truncatella angustata]
MNMPAAQKYQGYPGVLIGTTRVHVPLNLDETWAIVDDDMSELDEDSFDQFEDLIAEGFPHSKSARGPLKPQDDFKAEDGSNFIFGLDDLGKDLDGPEMHQLPEDQIDNNFIFGLDDLGMDVDGPKMHELPADDEDYEVGLSPRTSRPVFASHLCNSPEPMSEAAPPRPAQHTDNGFGYDADDEDSDYDALGNVSPRCRPHFCSKRPCILGCQQGDSKMPWRDATTFRRRVSGRPGRFS